MWPHGTTASSAIGGIFANDTVKLMAVYDKDGVRGWTDFAAAWADLRPTGARCEPARRAQLFRLRPAGWHVVETVVVTVTARSPGGRAG